MTGPAAGWYPDPAGSGGRRYWNGRDWTDVVVAPPGSEDPAPAGDPAPAPATPMAPPTTAPVLLPPGTPMDGRTSPWPAAPSGAGTMPPAPVPPPGTTIRLRSVGPDGQLLASWWRRFAGYLIDTVLIGLIVGVIVVIAEAVTGGIGTIFDTTAWDKLLAAMETNPGYQPSTSELQALFGPGFGTVLVWVTALTLLFGFLNGVLLVAATGQTVADRIVGTRKVLVGRRVPGFGPALVRWVIPTLLNLLQAVALVGLFAGAAWLLNYLWPIWDPRNQAGHDKAAGTYVELSRLAGPANR